MSKNHKITYAVSPEKTSTIMVTETETVSEVLRKIQIKEGDDGYSYLFYCGAEIHPNDIFYDYFDTSAVYIASKSPEIQKNHKITYAVSPEKTSTIMVTETETVSEVLRKIQIKEGDDGYSYLFYCGAEIHPNDIFYDYFDTSAVYIASKSPEIPEGISVD